MLSSRNYSSFQLAIILVLSVAHSKWGKQRKFLTVVQVYDFGKEHGLNWLHPQDVKGDLQCLRAGTQRVPPPPSRTRIASSPGDPYPLLCCSPSKCHCRSCLHGARRSLSELENPKPKDISPRLPRSSGSSGIDQAEAMGPAAT